MQQCNPYSFLDNEASTKPFLARIFLMDLADTKSLSAMFDTFLQFLLGCQQEFMDNNTYKEQLSTGFFIQEICKGNPVPYKCIMQPLKFCKKNVSKTHIYKHIPTKSSCCTLRPLYSHIDIQRVSLVYTNLVQSCERINFCLSKSRSNPFLEPTSTKQ